MLNESGCPMRRWETRFFIASIPKGLEYHLGHIMRLKTGVE